EGMAAIVTRCLQRDVNARYASAKDLAAALLPFAGEEMPTLKVVGNPIPTPVAISVKSPTKTTQPMIAPATTAVTDSMATNNEPGRWGLVVGLSISLGVLVLVISIWYVVSRAPAKPQPPLAIEETTSAPATTGVELSLTAPKPIVGVRVAGI